MVCFTLNLEKQHLCNYQTANPIPGINRIVLRYFSADTCLDKPGSLSILEEAMLLHLALMV